MDVKIKTTKDATTVEMDGKTFSFNAVEKTKEEELFGEKLEKASIQDLMKTAYLSGKEGNPMFFYMTESK